jgi:ammonium transporter, Amt family
MMFVSPLFQRLLVSAGALAITAMPALAQVATPIVPNKGDVAWMLMATALVLMMTIPGLALFYGGLVRTKNMLSMLSQVFAIVCIVSLMWVTFGYSLAFTGGGSLNDFIGGFSKVFLKGIDPNSVVPTFSNGVVIPEYIFLAFQMTFACITPALIVGAFAERMKFSALILFTVLWVIVVYIPIAHMVWYWGGPDALGDAAKAVVAAGSDVAKKAAAEAKLCRRYCCSHQRGYCWSCRLLHAWEAHRLW